MADTYCKIGGIDSMGNIIPESMTMGMSSTIADKRSATSCVFATLETSKPNERAKRMYIVEIRNIQPSDPCSGTPSTKIAMSSMAIKMTKASTK